MPWLTKYITRHITMQNAALQAARRSAKPAQYSKFRTLRNKVVKMIQNAKSSYFKNLDPRDKNQFWKGVKYSQPSQLSIITVLLLNPTQRRPLCLMSVSQPVSTETLPLSHLQIYDDHYTVHSSPCPDELLCTAEEVIFSQCL